MSPHPEQAPESSNEPIRRPTDNLRTRKEQGNEENRITEIPGVSLHRRTAPTPPCRTTYCPGIIVVAQGSFIYDEAHYLLTAVDLSIVSCVAEATQQFPCLVLSLKLDISMVREPISRDEIYVADAPADGHSRQLISTSA